MGGQAGVTRDVQARAAHNVYFVRHRRGCIWGVRMLPDEARWDPFLSAMAGALL
jgi:hypothetical protein